MGPSLVHLSEQTTLMKHTPDQHDASPTSLEGHPMNQPVNVPPEDPAELEVLNLALCIYERNPEKTGMIELECEINDATAAITEHLAFCDDISKHRAALLWLHDRIIATGPRPVGLLAIGDILRDFHNDENGARSCYAEAGSSFSAARRMKGLGEEPPVEA